MTMNPLFQSEAQFIDPDGVPYAGGTLATYIPGTDTPKATYADNGGATLNTNPIILDGAGRATIFGDGEYRCILHDAAGNLIFDEISSSVVSAAMSPVVIAPDLASARAAMGVTAAIQTETDRATAAEGSLTTHLNVLPHMMDWGTGTTDATGLATVSFAAAFSTGPLVVATVIGSAASNIVLTVNVTGASAFNVHANDAHANTPSAVGFGWVAVE